MNVSKMKQDTKYICEHPITRRQIDVYIKDHNWRQSMFTYDCVLISQQFKKQAQAFSHYDDRNLLIKMIVDDRNANAYLWIAVEIAKYEYICHIRFWEDRTDIWNSNDKELIGLSKVADELHNDLDNDRYIPPLQYSDYDLGK